MLNSLHKHCFYFLAPIHMAMCTLHILLKKCAICIPFNRVEPMPDSTKATGAKCEPTVVGLDHFPSELARLHPQASV